MCSRVHSVCSFILFVSFIYQFLFTIDTFCLTTLFDFCTNRIFVRDTEVKGGGEGRGDEGPGECCLVFSSYCTDSFVSSIRQRTCFLKTEYKYFVIFNILVYFFSSVISYRTGRFNGTNNIDYFPTKQYNKSCINSLTQQT